MYKVVMEGINEFADITMRSKIKDYKEAQRIRDEIEHKQNDLHYYVIREY